MSVAVTAQNGYVGIGKLRELSLMYGPMRTASESPLRTDHPSPSAAPPLPGEIRTHDQSPIPPQPRPSHPPPPGGGGRRSLTEGAETRRPRSSRRQQHPLNASRKVRPAGRRSRTATSVSRAASLKIASKARDAPRRPQHIKKRHHEITDAKQPLSESRSAVPADAARGSPGHATMRPRPMAGLEQPPAVPTLPCTAHAPPSRGQSAHRPTPS